MCRRSHIINSTFDDGSLAVYERGNGRIVLGPAGNVYMRFLAQLKEQRSGRGSCDNSLLGYCSSLASFEVSQHLASASLTPCTLLW